MADDWKPELCEEWSVRYDQVIVRPISQSEAFIGLILTNQRPDSVQWHCSVINQVTCDEVDLDSAEIEAIHYSPCIMIVTSVSHLP